MNITPDQIHHLEQMMLQENEYRLKWLQSKYPNRYNDEHELEQYIDDIHKTLGIAVLPAPPSLNIPPYYIPEIDISHLLDPRWFMAIAIGLMIAAWVIG